jgi:spermidine synthase
MKKTILLDQATTPDGRPMTLHEHDGVFMIRVDGVELMSTRQHHSEEKLAELACAQVGEQIGKQSGNARVLIGGLGLGFTLRAALGALGSNATVVVVELMPAVIRWNQSPDHKLAADAMADPRVEVIAGNVVDVLKTSRGQFDAIILDVDNGASGLTAVGNSRLYSTSGLAMIRLALRPDGCLAVWSADADPAFVERMGQAGFAVTVERARSHPSGGSWNSLFIGRVGRQR